MTSLLGLNKRILNFLLSSRSGSWVRFPAVATKFVRCKNLSTLESVSLVARIPSKAVGPMYTYRESHPRACKIPQGACR